MAPVQRSGALCAAASSPSRFEENGAGDLLQLDDFEAELERLSAVNQELMEQMNGSDDEPAEIAHAEPTGVDAVELELLRMENAELKARVEELQAAASSRSEELWLERQREYEMLLEEKSEVIRGLHQKIQEIQETPMLGGAPAATPSGNASGLSLGQAAEILRLKRELEDQRRQLEQDEEDMMTQMRQMEVTMAKERAEMARQRQETQRLKTDLAREIENSSRSPELRQRLNTLRRLSDPKVAMRAPADEAPEQGNDQKGSGFFRRLFG